MTRTFISVLLFLITTSSLMASTWDEPWREEILKTSDALVRGTVTEIHGDSHVILNVQKTLAGREIEGEIDLKGYFLLNMLSTTAGHGPSMPFEKGNDYYVLLKKKKDGVFQISTPTSGFDTIKKEKKNVIATYRHSYHQSRVPVSMYETTMPVLFKKYHDSDYDKKAVRVLVKKWLSKKPAGFDKKKIDVFFKQHAALESVYHLRLEGFGPKLLPFFKKDVFHVRVSAARAMVTCDSTACKKQLIDALEKSGLRTFTKVMAVRSLAELNIEPFRDRLKTIAEDASKEPAEFKSNLMDPRVGTSLPSLKHALNNLLSDKNDSSNK